MIIHKDFNFQAKTKTGTIYQPFYMTGERIQLTVGLRDEANQKELTTGVNIRPNGVPSQSISIPVVFLSNKYANADFLGKKVQGMIKITASEKDVQAEIKKAVKDTERAYRQILEQEINSLKDDDKVKLSMTITSFGKAFSLDHDKLSYDAGEEFSDKVGLIYQNEMADFESKNPYERSSSYSIKMSYKKFKQLAKKASDIKQEKQRKIKEERDAKFQKAKETNKPVVLDKTFLTGNQIPKAYKEPDSDIGTLYTLAMPDGQIKQKFQHNY